MAVAIVTRPPAGHRVARVHDQVDQHLLELTGVGQHVAERGIEVHVERHVGAEQAAEHRVDLAHHAVERQHARLEHLPAAEREQLASEAGGALAGVADLLEVGADRIARAGAPGARGRL